MLENSLVIIPFMIDKSSIISYITSKCPKCRIITDSKFIGSINFSDFDNINTSLNTHDIVLFDSVRMLATIVPALNLSNITAKLIILTTWGDTEYQLNIIINQFPYLKRLKFNISSIFHLKWEVVCTPMTSDQLKYYDMFRHKELGQDNLIKYKFTRMTTLYTYPDDIMQDVLNHKSICQVDTETVSDKLDIVTWLKYLNNIETHKLSSVLDGVISNWPCKQVVHSHFNQRFGVDLIVSCLKFMENPYETSEIFSVSCIDDYDSAIETLHKFNESSGILVTNISPFILLNDVNIIHVVDSYSFADIKMMLERCSKNNNISIYSHTAIHPNEKSSDKALYEDLCADIKKADDLYEELNYYASNVV